MLLLVQLLAFASATAATSLSASSLPWYLNNPHGSGQHSINVTGVWEQGFTGRDRTVCIVGDGLNMRSEGIRRSYSYMGSFNFLIHGPDPMPNSPQDYHGTLDALHIAGSGVNGCPPGVAYGGQVSGVEVMSTEPHLSSSHSTAFMADDYTLARALNFEIQRNDIFSCSWVWPEQGEGPMKNTIGTYVRRALAYGAQQGRGGLGNIYVFNADNNVHSGYKESIHAISVGNIDQHDRPLVQGKVNPAQMIVSYSTANQDVHALSQVVTNNHCPAQQPGPVSGSALAAGVYALVLEANPSLTLRDIQWLTVTSAVKVDNPAIQDYQMNHAVNKEYSHEVGFGKIDAYAMVEMARRWKPVRDLGTIKSPWYSIDQPLPFFDDNGDVIESEHEIFTAATKKWDPDVVEHVVLSVQLDGHTQPHDFSIQLTSPVGMISHFVLSETQTHHELRQFNFTTVAHWGESTKGKWRLAVTHRSGTPRSSNAKFVQWRMTIYGQLADVPRETVWPLEKDPHGPQFEDLDAQIPIQYPGAQQPTFGASDPPAGGHPVSHFVSHLAPTYGGLAIVAVVIFMFVLGMGAVLRYIEGRRDQRLRRPERYDPVDQNDTDELEKLTSRYEFHC